MNLYPEPRGDITRLPKWAQEHIADLTQSMQRMHEHLTSVSNPHPGSNLSLSEKRGYPAVTLPPSATIQFYLGTGREDYTDLIEVHHNRRRAGLDTSSLEVTGYGGSLLVLPRVSNGVNLRIDERIKNLCPLLRLQVTGGWLT